MVHLVRVPHPSDKVLISLRPDEDDEAAIVAVRGRVRVAEPAVADRLEQLLHATVAHRRAAGLPVTVDLDRLLDRATTDVAGRRPGPVVGQHP
ncbi:hypothetical protein [Actinomycetospora flava]|uniref:Uncharacterized protein n=1 Tax=Actinomycetospora flava TaxID=3129232 RepID=A0ABU8M9L0_9PSEU